MSEYRIDPLFGSISILSRERAARPHRVRIRDEVEGTGPCPLCPGNERLCPPEIRRIEGAGSRWVTRAFPNRYPAVQIEAEPELTDLMSFKPSSEHLDHPLMGFGAHEVLVDTPSHILPFWAQDPQDAVPVIQLLQTRVRELYQDRRLLYVQLFKNHRASAGASIEHPHFQLVGLPFVPAPVMKLMSPASCGVCALLESEMSRTREDKKPDSKRYLLETSSFVALMDYAPSYAYQFSIYPKHHVSGIEELTEAQVEDLVQICTMTLGRFERILGEFALNLAVYTRPNPTGFNLPRGVQDGLGNMHWFIRIYPRMIRHAGFELSTQIPIVQVAPEDAARTFREKAL